MVNEPPNPHKPLYRMQPPIYDKEQVEHVYQRLLDTPVTVTIRETLGLLLETQIRFNKDITNKQVINAQSNERETFLADAAGSDPLLFASELETEPVSILHLGLDAKGPYPCADDTVEQYMCEHPEDCDIICMGKESGALRMVWPVVANREAVECIIDPGSQIVVMSENVN